MATASLPVPVRVGQVWRDNDPRLQGRRLVRVVAVGRKRASVENVEHRHESLIGRRSSVALARFTPTRQTGYTLVKDAV